MKAGLIFTATTPASVMAIHEELRNRFGDELAIIQYEDPAILDEICERGTVTASAAARLVSMFMQSVNDGVDAMLCCCSSVGEVVDACQDLAAYVGVPILRIDEEMCRDAVRLGQRIGILATLPTTMEPTRNTVLRAARELDRPITLVDGLMEGAFGLPQEAFEAVICDKASEMIDQVDVLLLAQASMACMEKLLSERFQKPVLSSPRFGAAAMAKALERSPGRG